MKVFRLWVIKNPPIDNQYELFMHFLIVGHGQAIEDACNGR